MRRENEWRAQVERQRFRREMAAALTDAGATVTDSGNALVASVGEPDGSEYVIPISDGTPTVVPIRTIWRRKR